MEQKLKSAIVIRTWLACIIITLLLSLTSILVSTQYPWTLIISNWGVSSMIILLVSFIMYYLLIHQPHVNDLKFAIMSYIPTIPVIEQPIIDKGLLMCEFNRYLESHIEDIEEGTPAYISTEAHTKEYGYIYMKMGGDCYRFMPTGPIKHAKGTKMCISKIHHYNEKVFIAAKGITFKDPTNEEAYERG